MAKQLVVDAVNWLIDHPVVLAALGGFLVGVIFRSFF